MYDDNGKFLSQDDILELVKTEQGKSKVKTYLMRARIAYTVQCIFEALELEPTSDKQRLVCEVVDRCMIGTPTNHILNYIQTMKEYVDQNSYEGKYFISSDKINFC